MVYTYRLILIRLIRVTSSLHALASASPRSVHPRVPECERASRRPDGMASSSGGSYRLFLARKSAAEPATQEELLAPAAGGRSRPRSGDEYVVCFPDCGGTGTAGGGRGGSTREDVEDAGAAVESLANSLATIVNEAYEYGERGMWKESWPGRTDSADVAAKLRARKLLVLFKRKVTSADESPERFLEAEQEDSLEVSKLLRSFDAVGQVLVDTEFGGAAGEQATAGGTAEFGMLALAKEERSSGRGPCASTRSSARGLGRFLVSAAETYARDVCGKKTMRCELLEPVAYVHEVKKRLHEWYCRMGYVPQDGDAFESFFVPNFPHIANELAERCQITIYLKDLEAS